MRFYYVMGDHRKDCTSTYIDVIDYNDLHHNDE